MLEKYVMNASTDPIIILQSEIWWCDFEHVIRPPNLSGFDGSQLSGLHFTF